MSLSNHYINKPSGHICYTVQSDGCKINPPQSDHVWYYAITLSGVYMATYQIYKWIENIDSGLNNGLKRYARKNCKVIKKTWNETVIKNTNLVDIIKTFHNRMSRFLKGIKAYSFTI